MIRPSWSPTVQAMSHQPSPQLRMPRSRHIRVYSSTRSSAAAGIAASEWLIRYVQVERIGKRSRYSAGSITRRRLSPRPRPRSRALPRGTCPPSAAALELADEPLARRPTASGYVVTAGSRARARRLSCRDDEREIGRQAPRVAELVRRQQNRLEPWPIAAPIASQISSVVGGSGSPALSARSPGCAAASRISSAMFATDDVWKRLSPRQASATRRRPSTARSTKKSSRGSFAPGPWIAPGRRSVDGSGPASSLLLERSLAARVIVGVARLGRPLCLGDRHGRSEAAHAVERAPSSSA